MRRAVKDEGRGRHLWQCEADGHGFWTIFSFGMIVSEEKRLLRYLASFIRAKEH